MKNESKLEESGHVEYLPLVQHWRALLDAQVHFNDMSIRTRVLVQRELEFLTSGNSQVVCYRVYPGALTTALAVISTACARARCRLI